MGVYLHQRPRQAQGYVLLVLLLFVALLSVGLLTAVERIDFQIRRDREEELLHRGTEYSRAIRRFVKKFGRFPTAVEELESTNNMRFLRKRYKDPITGQDFRIVYALNPPSAPVQPNPPAGTRTTATNPSPANAQGTAPAAGGADPATADATAADPAADGQPGADPQAGAENQPETADAANPTDPTTPEEKAEKATEGTERVFGGPPMLGVVSRSKKKTIREFNKKDHYNEWQFIYDPTTDRGGLLAVPSQSNVNNSVQIGK